jgi:hypothetical protein
MTPPTHMGTGSSRIYWNGGLDTKQQSTLRLLLPRLIPLLLKLIEEKVGKITGEAERQA